jgi:ribosomal-protein-serine acetyltransferase
VQIKVAKGNLKSLQIPRRIGFKFEGIEREGELHMNEYFDLEVYSILKRDWQNL